MSSNPDMPPSERSSTPEQESTWSEPDQALHHLLEALFRSQPPIDPAATPPPSGRYLARLAAAGGFPAPALIGRELAIGESLGRYRVDEEVGRGGFGVVYRATDVRLGRAVAVKVPRPDRVQNVALWDRFAREARLAGALDHEAIVPVLDAGVLDGIICVVSAYQEGETLCRWLATRHPSGMPPRDAARLLSQLAAGVGHAHRRGILHRDLKPGNVMMVAPGREGGCWSPRITDFGLGTLEADDDSQTLTGVWQGSPPYMAPEQVLNGLGRVDARSDIYALGAILYEMLTGRTLYACASILELSLALGRGEPPARPRQLRHDLPGDLETIVLTCLERDPDRRYPSAAALHEDLTRFLDGRPILARPLSAPRRLGRWIRRKPSQAALVGLALLAAAVTAGLVVRHERQLSRHNVVLSDYVGQLKATVTQRDAAIAESKSTLDRLRASERTSRRTAFAADLRLADRELGAGRVEMVQALLRRYEPGPGQDDLRDFTWRHLMRQATREYSVHRLSNLRWWRGKRPLAPVLEGVSRALREQVLDRLGRVELDEDALRFSWDPWVPGSFVLGPRSIRWYYVLAASDGAWRPRVVDRPLEPGEAGQSRWCAISRDGRILAFAGESVTKAESVPPLKFHPDLTTHAGGPVGPGTVKVVEAPGSRVLGFSGDCRTLAGLARSSDSTGRPVVYDLESPWRASYPQYEVPLDNSTERRAIYKGPTLSYDGRLAAICGREPDLLRVFETRTGRSLWTLGAEALGPDAEVTCVAFADDGSALVTGDSRGQTCVWDPATGRALGRCPTRVGFVQTVGFHPDPRTVAIVASGEDAIRLWNYAPGPEPPGVLDHGDEVWGLAFTDGGESLVSVGDDNHARVWNVASGTPGKAVKSNNLVTAVAAGGPARGNPVAIAGYSGDVSVFAGNLAGKARHVFPELKGRRLRALAFAPDGQSLVAGGNFEKVLVSEWATELMPTSRLIDLPHKDTYGLAFSPDGETLAMGSHDGVITLWDVPAFRPRATLAAREWVSCVTISPDGTTLVSGDIEGGLQFWDMPAGTLRTTVARASESGGVWSLSFSPDRQTLATGGDDGMVRLWDPELAIQRLALSGHEAKVHAVAFSPDGKTLASGDFAGKIHLWRTGP